MARRKFGWHSGKLICNELIVENTVSLGTLDFGAAELDSLLIKGRMSTSTVAGAALSLPADYTYGEGMEFRWSVASWTGIGSSFKGMYIRSEAGIVGATHTLMGMELYGVANNVGVQNLKGLLSYAYIKGATAKTVGTAYAVHAELSWDASAASTTITTEMAMGLFRLTGGAASDYTKIHGAIFRYGDMDGASRTYGNGILIEDDAATSGTATLTTGINLAIGCTTGISITGTATTGISLATGTFTDAIKIAGTTTDGIDIGTVTNGVNFTGTITRGIDFTSSTIALSTDRGKSAISFGKRGSTAISLTMGTTGAKHWDPVQFNIGVIGTNPDAESTINLIYQNLAHSTADMANLRLKGSDWTMDIQKNVKDAYVYQGEIDFSTNALAVGGEAAGLGITMSATSAVTGNVWGAVFAMSGSGLGTSAGVFISARSSAVLTHGVYLEPSTGTTITNLLYLNQAGTATNFFKADADNKGCIGNTRATPNQTATCDGSLKVIIGADTLYIPLYNAVTLA